MLPHLRKCWHMVKSWDSHHCWDTSLSQAALLKRDQVQCFSIGFGFRFSMNCIFLLSFVTKTLLCFIQRERQSFLSWMKTLISTARNS